jgi:hypothetical protein
VCQCEEAWSTFEVEFIQMKWTIRCEELVGLGVKRVGALLRYGLLRVKWTISVREVRSTFEVWFIKVEVDRRV